MVAKVVSDTLVAIATRFHVCCRDMMFVGDIIACRLLSASRSPYTPTPDADKAFLRNHTSTITLQQARSNNHTSNTQQPRLLMPLEGEVDCLHPAAPQVQRGHAVEEVPSWVVAEVVRQVAYTHPRQRSAL